MDFSGIFYLFLFFGISFAVVHLFKLAYLGILSLKKPEPPKEDNPPKKPEPVYYIVEKRRTKKKANYNEPREIKFK